MAYKFYVNKYVYFKQESLLSEINHYREPKPEYEQLDIMDGISKIQTYWHLYSGNRK